MNPARSRVLLVEDDASIARFVAMALDVFDVELHTCSTVAQALQALRAQPVRLIITDLMLPGGESGAQLVRRLAQDPALGQGAPVAVYSAGLTPLLQEQLRADGVWRILAKPTPLQDLEDCVRQALSMVPAPSKLPGPALAESLTPAELDAIATHFMGNAALFTVYRTRCQQQFANDRQAGDTAAAALDLSALRRQGHSLATVLFTLGRASDSALARQLEDAAAHADAAAALQAWQQLRDRL